MFHYKLQFLLFGFEPIYKPQIIFFYSAWPKGKSLVSGLFCCLVTDGILPTAHILYAGHKLKKRKGMPNELQTED